MAKRTEKVYPVLCNYNFKNGEFSQNVKRGRNVFEMCITDIHLDGLHEFKYGIPIEDFQDSVIFWVSDVAGFEFFQQLMSFFSS